MLERTGHGEGGAIGGERHFGKGISGGGGKSRNGRRESEFGL